MVFKIATHGGRYLCMNDNHELKEDTNYDMSESANGLASFGSLFNVTQDDHLTGEDGKTHVTFDKKELLVKQVAPNEYAIQTSDGSYLFAGLDKLKLSQESGAMAMFTLKHH